MSARIIAGGIRHAASAARCKLGHEVLHEQRDVFAPIAQGRDRNREHVKAVVQILAEPSSGDLRAQAAIRRGDHAHVHP